MTKTQEQLYHLLVYSDLDLLATLDTVVAVWEWDDLVKTVEEMKVKREASNG